MNAVQMSSSTRYYCVAEGCSSDTRKVGKYGYMKEIKFFPFPTKKSNPKSRKIWLNYLRRNNFEPTHRHRLCSLHFPDGEPTNINPYPTLFKYNHFKEPTNIRNTDSIHKRSVSYNINNQTITLTTGEDQVQEEDADSSSIAQGYIIDSADKDTQSSIQLPPAIEEIIVSAVEEKDKLDYKPCPKDHDYCTHGINSFETVVTSSIHVQTDITMEEMEQLMTRQQQDPKTLMREEFVGKVTENDKSVMQYTGIPSRAILIGIFGIFEKASSNLKYWCGQQSSDDVTIQSHQEGRKSGPSRKLSKFEEFIMTLLRMRLAIFTFFLADIFNVSNARVSQICTTWINFMHNIFTPLLIWPSSQIIKKFSPRSFKRWYPNTVCIIDCTEFFIQKPRSPTAQSKTFSSYKHHNTYKCLIGISPSGAITFVSNLWGGNASDRYITKMSGFLEHVKPGDEIMADRGFLIRDLLLKRRAKLVIPPFTVKCKWGKGKRLTQTDILKTKSIARMRIHVERAIERLKNFHILGNTMPLTYKPLANQMVKVCAFLCNLQKPLVSC